MMLKILNYVFLIATLFVSVIVIEQIVDANAQDLQDTEKIIEDNKSPADKCMRFPFIIFCCLFVIFITLFYSKFYKSPFKIYIYV